MLSQFGRGQHLRGATREASLAVGPHRSLTHLSTERVTLTNQGDGNETQQPSSKSRTFIQQVSSSHRPQTCSQARLPQTQGFASGTHVKSLKFMTYSRIGGFSPQVLHETLKLLTEELAMRKDQLHRTQSRRRRRSRNRSRNPLLPRRRNQLQRTLLPRHTPHGPTATVADVEAAAQRRFDA